MVANHYTNQSLTCIGTFWFGAAAVTFFQNDVMRMDFAFFHRIYYSMHSGDYSTLLCSSRNSISERMNEQSDETVFDRN